MTTPLAKLALEDGTVYTGRAFGAAGESSRRSRLQHQHDRLSGSADRSVLQGADRDHDLSAHRQLRHQRRGSRIAPAFRSRASSSAKSIGCRAIFARSAASTPTWPRTSVIGLAGIDTRALVRRLRVRGAMNGVLSTTDLDDASLVAQGPLQSAHRRPGPGPRRHAGQGVRLDGRLYQPVRLARICSRGQDTGTAVVALDFGMKWNILRCLVQIGCEVTVVPGTATARDILACEPDGIFVSNGPGDPEPLDLCRRNPERADRQETDLRHLPGPSAAGPGVWAPRRSS